MQTQAYVVNSLINHAKCACLRHSNALMWLTAARCAQLTDRDEGIPDKGFMHLLILYRHMQRMEFYS